MRSLPTLLGLALALATAACGSTDGQEVTRELAEPATPPVAPEPVNTTLIDLQDPAELERLFIVNDGVMGGLSQGYLSRGEEGLRFSGDLSLDNNGGFSSFRSNRDLDLSYAEGGRIVLRFRGDGRVYRFRLRMTDDFNVPSYTAEFGTKEGELMERSFTREDFVCTWRGYLVRDAPELDLSQVRALGFVIADKKEGPFEFELLGVDVRSKR